MIVCPNCNHQNPEGALQCENCSTPLPATTNCPNCGASVQTDATFCGQCGFNLQVEIASNPISIDDTALRVPDSITEQNLPEQAEIPTEPSPQMNSPWDEEEENLTTGQAASTKEENSWIRERTDIMQGESPSLEVTPPWEPLVVENSDVMPWESSFSNTAEPEELFPVDEMELTLEPEEIPAAVNEMELTPPPMEIPPIEKKIEPIPELKSEPKLATPTTSETNSFDPSTGIPTPATSVNTPSGNSATRLQTQTVKFFHVQTNTSLEVPANLAVIHIGKPNTQIPPDIDVSGFPNSEVVSRIHADIRVEGDAYFIEDVGSSNGTYINHSPLLSGNRHRLRTGDRIALGKGDLVSFIFQIT
jgi:ribosomal protein L40E